MRAQTQFVGEMSCTIYLIRTIVTTYHSYGILMNSIVSLCVYFENVVSSFGFNLAISCSNGLHARTNQVLKADTTAKKPYTSCLLVFSVRN